MGGTAAGVSQHQPSLFPVICLAVIGHTAFTASRLTVSLAAIQMKAPTLTVGGVAVGQADAILLVLVRGCVRACARE